VPKGEQRDQAADVSTSPPGQAGPKKGQTPGQNLEGAWAVVSVEDNDRNTLDFDPIFSHAAGAQAPIRDAQLTFRDGTFALKTGLVSLEGSYSVGAAATAKEITLSFPTGSPDRQGLISLSGVYSLDGDNLTITFSRLPASPLADLAGKEPGVRYMLRREALPMKEAREK
jgi:uncharacterized protein (TIGR03067 family)